MIRLGIRLGIQLGTRLGRPVLLIPALLLFGFTLSGCATRFLQDEPLVFEQVGPVEVDVESFAGDVRIHASEEKFSSIRVVVRREAVHGTWREGEAAASLEDIDYHVDLGVGEFGSKLTVRTSTAHAEPHFQRAHVRITLPATEGVRIRTKHGYVEARGVAGRLDLQTSENDLRVLTNQPLTRDVTLITSEGDIDYRVRGESRGEFDAVTIDGRIVRRVRYGRFISEAGSSYDRLRGRLNDGTNRVRMRTSDGDIRIAVVHNPEQVGRLIVD